MYIVSSKTVRAIDRDLVSKTKSQNKAKEKRKEKDKKTKIFFFLRKSEKVELTAN